MSKKHLKWLALSLLVFIIASACSLSTLTGLFNRQSAPTPEGAAVTVPVEVVKTAEATPSLVPVNPNVTSGGPVLITGTFTYTNEFYPEGYAYEHAVSLIDVTGFVKRDEEWQMPVEAQTLGYVDMNYDTNTGNYRIELPIQPAGTFNDVDHDGQTDTGVQIYAVEYSPNWTGGPFYVKDDPYIGWPSYLASLTVDTENQDEVTGGRLLVWAPDDQQSFPTSFGPDGLLFTDDDPEGPLPAGYSVIDLDQQPFGILRDRQIDMTLYEPTDVAVKDYSSMSYTDAFNQMFDVISKEYAFNGISGKQPDWQALYDTIYPRIQQAEQNNDPYSYYLAMRDFSLSFKDGHVGLNGGDMGTQYNRDNITGGYGFAIRELDDGTSVVVYILSGGPADQAGMKVGATLIAVDGVETAQAISQVKPFSPQSTAYGLRYEQAIFLLRGAVGVQKQFTFANPGEAQQAVSLTSIWEMDSLFATYMGGSYDENVLPVEYKVLPQNIGYIRMNSNSDDLNLAYHIFQRALDTFQNVGVSGLIIDLRRNFGGSPLGVAGYLYDQDITLGQLEYYSDKTGKFEPEGDPQRVIPMTENYKFDKLVMLVDQFCYSACEIEAYGLSQVPGMVVMGESPTAGVEAETARGDFKLPAGMEITIPTGRFTLPDGSIFLEGTGVAPTVKIPVDRNSVLSTDDLVLQDAINSIVQ
jgi:C-terminal processing protease CtpA/Prc